MPPSPLHETSEPNGICVVFPFFGGGPPEGEPFRGVFPLYFVLFHIGGVLPPGKSSSRIVCRFLSKFAWNDWGEWDMCSFFHLLVALPPGKRWLRNLHGTPPSNLKKCGKKLEICKKPLRPMASEVSFPSIIGRIPPGKRRLRNLHGISPSNLKNAAKVL